MFLRNCAASVEVTDIDAVPLDYQSVTVTMPASMFSAVLNVLDEVFGEKVLPEIGTTVSRTADKRAIKAAIEWALMYPARN
jgi:hypothetical protein